KLIIFQNNAGKCKRHIKTDTMGVMSVSYQTYSINFPLNKFVSILQLFASIPYCQPRTFESFGASGPYLGAFFSEVIPACGCADQRIISFLKSFLLSAALLNAENN